jgi:D-beta-D-heptose 7-phosphate kinase/D-beta-D-heptose 1-phosphate adenosyltransferase
MYLYDKKGTQKLIKSVAQEVFDVSGAGDTVVSTFTQSLVSGASLKQAAFISNIAAGIVVGKFGTEVISPSELINGMKKMI